MLGESGEEEEEGAPPGWEIVEPQPPTTPSLPFSPTDINMGIEQLEVQEEEEGPPPGWHIIPQLQSNAGNENMDDDDDEGPPPGWDFTPKPELTGHENKEIEEERQPPGCHLVPLPESIIGNDHQDIEEEGPPGWPSMPPTQQNIMIEKQEIEVQTELGSHFVPSLQIRIRSKLEAVEDKEIGIQHEKSSIDPLQPVEEYKQDIKGAQPGLNSIPLPQPRVTSPMAPPLQLPLSDTDIKSEPGVADEEGPPPGWHSAEPNKTNSEHQDIKDGASRGWTSPAKPKTELQKDIIIEDAGLKEQDIIDEGPPPGWILKAPPQSNTGSENQAIKSEGSPHGSHFFPPLLPKLDSIKQDIGEERPQSKSNYVSLQSKMGHSQQEVKEERSQPGSNSMPPPSPQIRPPMPATTPMSTASRRPTKSGSRLEMGQMVCGSCRRLLSYARGAKYVQCSCCQTVNLVLEAHQVGQVKCDGCEVLLMYQFGANAVQCASCRHVTEIVVQNRRPPLSVQQARGRQHGNFNR